MPGVEVGSYKTSAFSLVPTFSAIKSVNLRDAVPLRKIPLGEGVGNPMKDRKKGTSIFYNTE